jgi:uncharacterized membrane protein
VQIDKEFIELGVDRSDNFTVKLTAPEEAKANENGTVFIRVESVSDRSVWDGKKLLGLINPTFRIEMETLVPNKWVDPGKSVEFLVTIRNVGNIQGRVTIFLTSSEARPGWNAVLDRETLFLAGGEQTIIRLTVSAPANALAGSRQVIEVHAVSEDFSSRGDVQVSALVNRVYGLNWAIDPPEVSIHAGEKARYLISVTNDGNGNEIVSLNAARVSPGWIVSYELDDVGVRDVVLLSKETKAFTVIVSTPFDALAGRSQIQVVLLDESGTDYTIPISVRIVQFFGVDLTSSKYQGEGAPKGIVNYRLTLENDGNGDDTFSLEYGGLPTSLWDGGFHDMQGRPISDVTLGPGDKIDVEMRVHIPEGASTTDPIDFFVRATSSGAESDDVKLKLDVELPDLKIQAVEYNPARPDALESVQITVRVTNDGTYASENVNVVLKDGQKEVGREVLRTITKGSNATASFTWVPTVGTHRLTYEISNDIPEISLENNVLEHTKTISEDKSLPGFDALAMVIVLVIVIIVGLIQRVRGPL